MSKNLKIDVKVREDQLAEDVRRILDRALPKWVDNFGHELTMSPLTGGISNKLFACYPKSKGVDSSHTLLFRIYGHNSETFINREEEIDTMEKICSINLGPKFYCGFINGICYEYLPGSIIDHKMASDPNVFPKIAESIANLHLLNYKGVRTDQDLDPNEEPFIFSKIRQLLDLIQEDYSKSMRDMTSDFLKKTPSLSQLKEEFRTLETHVKKETKAHRSLIVFCHNDLLLGNIIYNATNNSVKFIDYEYSHINYQAYDIANHFNEFAGVDEPDYSLFPSRQFQLEWLRIYLNAFNSRLKSSDAKTIDDQMIVDFYNQVTLFTLTSHFMWGVWALVQAHNSLLEFDFVRYANIRFNEYFKNKLDRLK